MDSLNDCVDTFFYVHFEYWGIWRGAKVFNHTYNND